MDITSKLLVNILYPPKVNKAKLPTELSNILFLSVKTHTPPNNGMYIC